MRFLIHNYFPQPADAFVLNLASQDPLTLARSRAMAERGLRLSARLGAPFYSVHSGFLAEFLPESLGQSLEHERAVPREMALETFHESVSALADVAQSVGVDLLLEPNVLDRRNLQNGQNALLLLVEASEIAAFLRRLSRPEVGLLLDTGHLNVSATTLGFSREAFIGEIAAHVRGFHVHDNDGSADQHRPATADGWVLELLRRPQFRTLPVVLEAGFADVRELVDYHRWFSAEMIER